MSERAAKLRQLLDMFSLAEGDKWGMQADPRIALHRSQ
jgi:hypothetical protein